MFSCTISVVKTYLFFLFRQTHPLLHDMNCIFMLLMNFMYEDVCVKESLTKEGLADVVHKLWVWIALNKTVSTSALKLLATFTTKCTLGTVIINVETNMIPHFITQSLLINELCPICFVFSCAVFNVNDDIARKWIEENTEHAGVDTRYHASDVQRNRQSRSTFR